MSFPRNDKRVKLRLGGCSAKGKSGRWVLPCVGQSAVGKGENGSGKAVVESFLRGCLNREKAQNSARAGATPPARLNVTKIGNKNINDNFSHKNALKAHKNSVI